MDAVYRKLEDVFSDVFEEDIELTPGLTAEDVEGWDSLAHIRLMLSVERAFKVKFSTLEINGLRNVGDLVTLIEKHRSL